MEDAPDGAHAPNVQAQEWLEVRFDGLQPEDIFDGLSVAIYSAEGLVAPSVFQPIWQSVGLQHRGQGSVSREERRKIALAEAVLVLADLNDDNHVQDVLHLVHFIKRYCMRQRGPHIIVAQHSFDQRAAINESSQGLARVLRKGVDVILEERTGFHLAWDLQNRISRKQITMQWFQQRFREKCMKLQVEGVISWYILDTLWHYLRVRINRHLPPIDPNIAPGPPQIIDGLQLGNRLGTGAFGTVHRLMRDGNASGQVLKTISKHGIADMDGVKTFSQQIEVMKLLSSQNHPNVTRLLGIHHSETHIFFRLEDGGPTDLQQRLHDRDNGPPPGRSLSSRMVQSILSQVSRAISYLHKGPRIAHLDIKPANIIVSETADDIRASIADFGSAIARPPSGCQGVRGSFPFIAPEQFRQKEFEPFPADVWSMAMVFLKTACGLGCLEYTIHFPRLPPHSPLDVVQLHEKNKTLIVHQFFCTEGATSRILQDQLLPSLQDLMDSMLSILPCMFAVMPRRRATSWQVAKAFKDRGFI